MSVIDSYLETLFSPYPDSARMQEARVELRTMMDDQYQGLREDGLTESQALGKVIAEFGSLDEVSTVLGIDREVHGGAADPGSAEPAAQLTLEQMREYTAAVRGSQLFSAVAIPLFVLSPVPLLLLFAIDGRPSPATWTVAAGLVTLLVMVTIGVLTLTLRESRLADFEDIEEGRSPVTATARSYARDLRREERRGYTVAMAGAVALWILSAVPTLLFAFATEGSDNTMVVLFGVSGTLVMVALGLFLSIRSSWAEHVASTLLQDEDEDAPETSDSPVIRVIAAVYWPLAAAIYLAWSFGTGDWQISWIIWPVAGVLYAALWSVNTALTDTPDSGSRRSARR